MKKKIGIILTILLVTAACLLSSWLLIGEPVDGKQLAYQITEHPFLSGFTGNCRRIRRCPSRMAAQAGRK